MIIDFILSAVLSVVYSILDHIPIMSLSIDTGIITVFIDIVKTVLYFFPWQYVLPILHIIISLQTIRITLSMFRLLLSFIPGKGA